MECDATAHLVCLEHHFSEQDDFEIAQAPRGGDCPQCSSYVLWGDIMRGCSRRHDWGAAIKRMLDAEDEDEQELGPEIESLTIIQQPRTKGKTKAKVSRKITASGRSSSRDY